MLLSLPPELLVAVLQWLEPLDLARVDRACDTFHSPSRPLVEQALRQRAAERGAAVPTVLPAGEASWAQFLSWQERRAALPQPQRVSSAGGLTPHTAFVDAHGRLLTCGAVVDMEAASDDEYDVPSSVFGHGPLTTVLAVPTRIQMSVCVRAVATALEHTLVLTEGGDVLSFGVGDLGRLGHGNQEDQHTPKLIEALRGERAVAVAAGQCHSLVLTAQGSVLSFGDGGHGCLGHGSGALANGNGMFQFLPKVVEALRGERVAAISAGDFHSFVLTREGALLSCGYGWKGRLGHGDEEDQHLPKLVEALRGVRVVAVSTGDLHSLVLADTGAVYSFGQGGGGRLGLGQAAARDWEGQHAPKLIEALRGERVVAMAAGEVHSLVLTEAGRLLSFGQGGCGCLGHGDETDHNLPKLVDTLQGRRVAAVAAGEHASLCVLEDGRVLAWGNGEALGQPGADAGALLTPREYPKLRVWALRALRPAAARGAGESSQQATLADEGPR